MTDENRKPASRPVEEKGRFAPITQAKSFAFRNGKYIRQPYRLQIDGPVLTLNGEKVFEHPTAPLSMGKSMYQEELPILPPEITASSSWADFKKFKLNGRGWSERFFSYYFSHFEPEEALKRVQVALRDLPFVASAEIIEAPEFGAGKKYLQVKTKAGDQRDFLTSWGGKERTGFDFVYDLPDYRPYSKQVIHDNLIERASRWQELLQSETILVNTDDGAIVVKREKHPKRWEEIVNVVDVLQSAEPSNNKIREIRNRLYDRFDDRKLPDAGSDWDIVKILVANFVPDEQLTQRIEKLRPQITIPLWRNEAK